jgi:hypothetical protein
MPQYPPSSGETRRRDSPDRVTRRRGSSASRNGSSCCPPSVWEVTDGGIEKVLIPLLPHSPRRIASFDNDYAGNTERERVVTEKAIVKSPKRNRSREPFYDHDDVSDMTERERIVEMEAKHVTFQDSSPSLGSSAWSQTSDRSESFLKRKTSWDESAVARNKW